MLVLTYHRLSHMLAQHSNTWKGFGNWHKTTGMRFHIPWFDGWLFTVKAPSPAQQIP